MFEQGTKHPLKKLLSEDIMDIPYLYRVCAREEHESGVGWRIFFRISFVFGLTKEGFGCILYDIGSIKSRCSPQK